MRRLRAADIALTLGAAIALVIFWKLRLYDPGDHFAWQSRDPYNQIFPMWYRAGEWMREGHVPLWNPYQMAGHPFLGSLLYGIFYPLNAARLFLPAAAAMEVTLVIHLFAAWLFAFFFARTIHSSRLAAVASATIFALSGNTLLDGIWFLPAIGAIVWIPLALLGVEKIVETGRPAWAVPLAVAVAMPVLSGWLQDWLHLMHAIAIYAGLRVLFAWRQNGALAAFRASGLMVVGGMIGVSLAAVQLLPSMELQALGWRNPSGLSLHEQLPLGPVPLLKWLGDAVRSEPGLPNYGYVGIATLLLVPISAFRFRRPQVTALWLIGVWGVLCALTVATPAFALYRGLPAGTWFREPWRLVVLYSFASAMLAGVGLDVLREAPRRTLLSACFVATIAASAWGLGVAVSTRSAAILLTAAALIWACWFVPRWRGVAALALTALVSADLFLACYVTALRPYKDPTPLDREAPLLEFVRRHQGLYRTYLDHPWPFEPHIMGKQGTLRGIYMVTDYEILSLDRTARYYRAIESGEVAAPASDFIGLLRLGLLKPDAVKLLSLLGVKFVMAEKSNPYARGFESFGWRPLYVPVASEYVLYENPAPIPRASFVYSSVVVEKADDALATLLDDGFDVRRSVVIEGRGATEFRSTTSPTALEPKLYQPTQVVAEGSAEHDGYLLLTDTFFPGWNAYVDGRPVPIDRADYLFRAVPVTAGKHRVEFRYEPWPFYAGALISSLALFVIASMLALHMRRGTGAVR